jgi:hypothetical protein
MWMMIQALGCLICDNDTIKKKKMEDRSNETRRRSRRRNRF